MPGSVFAPVAGRLAELRTFVCPLHVGDTWLQPFAGSRMQDLLEAEHPDLHRYSETQGLPVLVSALVEKVRARNQIACEPGGVLVTAGATGALGAAVGMCSAPGEEVLVLAPFWPLIRGIVQAFRATPVEVPFYDRVDSAEAAVAAVRERMTDKSVALYVSTPSNPTGRVLPAAWLEALAELARSEGLWLNLVYPSLLIALLFSCATLVSYFFAFSEKRYLKLAFQHYVPPAVVEDLVADAGALRLGGEKRELTVLFSDIRGFTALSEGLPPEELVKLMNEYFTVMTERVFAHRGSLDKYIGDAIMAVYGAPVAENEHPAQACRSALDMLCALDGLQQKWRPAGLPAIGIGVGINTGPMVVGNMGSATRFNYTVVGDAVNLASRIESLNKTYGTSILISEYTYERIKGEFSNVREVDSVRVRGREQPVRLYEIFPEGKFTADFLEQYRQAYAAMNAGDYARSAPMFAQLHASAGDGVSAFHAQRRGPDRRRVGESTIMS